MDYNTYFDNLFCNNALYKVELLKILTSDNEILCMELIKYLYSHIKE